MQFTYKRATNCWSPLLISLKGLIPLWAKRTVGVVLFPNMLSRQTWLLEKNARYYSRDYYFHSFHFLYSFTLTKSVLTWWISPQKLQISFRNNLTCFKLQLKLQSFTDSSRKLLLSWSLVPTHKRSSRFSTKQSMSSTKKSYQVTCFFMLSTVVYMCVVFQCL